MTSVYDFMRGIAGIAGADAAGRSIPQATEASAAALRALEDRLERLVLVNTAMWEILRDKAKITEEDLMLKVLEIDLRDGNEDSKVTRTVAKCEKCGRAMSPRHAKCIYCGAERLVVSAFDRV
jgi:hypothetical protein